MSDVIPSKEDWGNFESDLDKKYAFQIFYGKSNEEMESEYLKNVIGRTTDLKFMPSKPFLYYMMGFEKFVRKYKNHKLEAPDIANCFITLVEEKLRDNPGHILPIINNLLETVEDIANTQSEWRADKDIYGSFQDRYKSILNLLSKI